MNGNVSAERLAAFERLRHQFPPTDVTLKDAQQSLRNQGGEVSLERFEHEVDLLKRDIRRSGLTTILWGIAVLLSVLILSGFIIDKSLLIGAVFVLLAGSSWYFMRKQKNYELTMQIDRELLGRE